MQLHSLCGSSRSAEQHALQGWDIVMHGGEFYDSEKDKMHCKSEVYVYSVAKDSWRQVVIPNR